MRNLLINFLVVGSGLGVLFFSVLLAAATTPPLNTFSLLRFFCVFGLLLFLVSFVFFMYCSRALSCGVF